MGRHAGQAEQMGTGCAMVAGGEASTALQAGAETPLASSRPFHHAQHCAFYLGLSAGEEPTWCATFPAGQLGNELTARRHGV